jgi:hypothetical protein
MKKIIIGIFIAQITILFANGGPINQSTFYGTGRIQIKSYEDIEIKSEELNVELIGDWSIV